MCRARCGVDGGTPNPPFPSSALPGRRRGTALERDLQAFTHRACRHVDLAQQEQQACDHQEHREHEQHRDQRRDVDRDERTDEQRNDHETHREGAGHAQPDTPVDQSDAPPQRRGFAAQQCALLVALGL